MEYGTVFLTIAALLSFFDLVLISASKLNGKRRSSYGVYAAILALALIVISLVDIFGSKFDRKGEP